MQQRGHLHFSFIGQGKKPNKQKPHFIRVHTVIKRKIHELDGKSQTCKFMTLFFYVSASCMSKEYQMTEQLKGKTEEIQKMSNGMSWSEKSSQRQNSKGISIQAALITPTSAPVTQRVVQTAYACEYIHVYTAIYQNRHLAPPKKVHLACISPHF